MLLLNTNGALPDVNNDYAEMVAYIRRSGHLTDRGIDPTKSLNYMTSHEPESDWAAANHAWLSEEIDGGYMGAYPAWPESSDGSQSGYDDASSCCSQELEMNFEDLAGMEDAEIGENLYLAYAFAKKRWRLYQGQRRRKGGKGKGKGGKGKGKGKKHNAFMPRRHFLADGSDAVDDSMDETQLMYKGSGKGKSGGKKRSGNPLGRDGKQLTCRNCGSTDHFAHACKAAASSSGHSHSGTFLADVTRMQQQAASSSASSNASMSSGFFAFTQSAPAAPTGHS